MYKHLFFIDFYGITWDNMVLYDPQEHREISRLLKNSLDAL